MQFVVPTAAVMGLLFAAFPPIARSLALAREQKVLKRLQGTPLPMWAYLLGQMGGAVILATLSVAVMVGVGVVLYNVQLPTWDLPATLVTLVLGIGCLAAVGLAIGALAPSASTAQAASMAAAVALSFVSGVFLIGATLADWLVSIANIFPVRYLLLTLWNQFNTVTKVDGWDLRTLSMLTLWGVGGVIVAVWALNRQPRISATAAPAEAEVPTGGASLAAVNWAGQEPSPWPLTRSAGPTARSGATSAGSSLPSSCRWASTR